MVVFSDRLRDVLSELLGPHGFVAGPGSMTFIRHRESIAEMISFLVDPRGDLEVLALTANVAVGIVGFPADGYVTRERLLTGHMGGVRLPARDVVTRNIGYLMPEHEWHEWEIDIHSRPDRVARDMVDTVLRCGLPWFARFSSPAEVLAESRRATIMGVHDLTRRPMRRQPVNGARFSYLYRAAGK